MAKGDTVAGMLDRYTDPDCDCTLLTRFEGLLRDNRIEGRYSSKNMETGGVTIGEWSVHRQ